MFACCVFIFLDRNWTYVCDLCYHPNLGGARNPQIYEPIRPDRGEDQYEDFAAAFVYILTVRNQRRRQPRVQHSRRVLNKRR